MKRTQLNSITRLARTGALEQAWALFAAEGFLSGSEDPDILTVHGRLLKDRAAQATGAAREALLNEAIAAYARASELSRATYPLINAATLAFLAGRPNPSRRLAIETIALLDSGDFAPETPYWLGATRAEALLLLGRPAEAQAALADAIRSQPEAWEDHASTLRQFALILREMGADEAWLAPFRPPPCLHFEGILGIAADDMTARAAIAAEVEAVRPSYAIGALAAGADILIAEAVIRAGGYLHAVLPCPAEHFRALSVTPFGGDWDARFARLMDEAASVIVLDDRPLLSGASVAIAREAAMGLAIQESRRLQTSARALRVRPAGETDTPLDDRLWTAQGLPLREIGVARSSDTQSILARDRTPAALLAVPEGVSVEPPPTALAALPGPQDSGLVYRFAALGACAGAAVALLERAPEVRLGIDYRALSAAGEDGDESALRRAAFLASAGLKRAAALSESAALALALHRPEASVQPMGDLRTPHGDMPIFGLFGGTGSGD
jgi:hypothetical protein